MFGWIKRRDPGGPSLEAITRKFEQMLEEGFMDEMKALRARGDLRPEMPSMRCVGYRQAWACLEGEYGFEEMREKALAATRQLAKRQLTWLRRWPDLHWVDSLGADPLEEVLNLVRQCRT